MQTISIKDTDILNTSYDHDLSSGDFAHPLRQFDIIIPQPFLELIKTEVKLLKTTASTLVIDNQNIALGKIHRLYDTAALITLNASFIKEHSDLNRFTQLVCFSVSRSSVEIEFEIRDDDCISHYNVDITKELGISQTYSTPEKAVVFTESMASEFSISHAVGHFFHAWEGDTQKFYGWLNAKVNKNISIDLAFTLSEEYENHSLAGIWELLNEFQTSLFIGLKRQMN